MLALIYLALMVGAFFGLTAGVVYLILRVFIHTPLWVWLGVAAALATTIAMTA